MPTANPTLGTTDYKFKGHTLKVPVHFSEGDTLDAKAAKFANRMLASVTGNAFASAVNRKVAALQTANDALPVEQRRAEAYGQSDISATDAQLVFDTIFTAYEIGGDNVRGEGVPRDPIASIANNIAWERIKKLLAKKKIKASSVKPDKRASFIKELLAKDPSILEQAKAAYGDDEATDGLDDALFAGLGEDTATAPAAADTTADTVAGSDTTTAPEAAPGADAIPGGMVNSDDVSGEPADVPAAVPGVENPGEPEIAPDASAGEKTPKRGAFA